MIRPSALNRVFGCPASPRLIALAPKPPENAAAAEGSEAHDYARRVLSEAFPVGDIPVPEMREAVRGYTDLVTSYTDRQAAGGIEDKITCDFGGYTVTGTPDVWTCGSGDGSLTIIDLKYGYLPVSPQSWQLISYACMVWADKWGRKWTPTEVNLIIYQPRGRQPEGRVKRFTFNGDLLRNYTNQIANAIGISGQPDSQAIPGTHCYRCPAILGCVANRRAVLGAMDVSETGGYGEFTPDNVAFDYEDLQRASVLIKNRLNAAEEYIAETIRSGGCVPGYGLSPSSTKLTWAIKDPVAAAAELGVDIRKPVEPITPTQAVTRGLLTQGQVEFMSSRQPGKLKVKKIDLSLAENLIKNT